MANSSVAETVERTPRRLPETARTTAKADLRKAESERLRSVIGRAIDRARQLRGWSLKELAGAVDRDERQVSRWISGEERPQFDALIAVESFRQPLIVAFAEIAGEGVTISTTIEIRRTA